MHTAASHISCILRCFGISLIQHGTDAYKDIFIYTFKSGWVKFYGQKTMIKGKFPLGITFLANGHFSMQKSKNDNSIMEIIPWIDHLLM